MLDLSENLRLSIRGKRFPAILELLQSRREQRIVGPTAVSLDRRRDCTDFGLELLELTYVCEQSIALACENSVDALVVTAANIPDELSKPYWIFNGVCRQLPDFCGSTCHDQPGNRLDVVAGNRSLERLFL